MLQMTQITVITVNGNERICRRSQEAEIDFADYGGIRNDFFGTKTPLVPP
jgi:hypothetical protein